MMEENVLFNEVARQINQHLKENLSWLTNSFGFCERLVKIINRKRVYTPNVYIKDNDYLNLSPSDTLGNYSFFVSHDPQKIVYDVGLNNRVSGNISIIFWFDLRTIYTENVHNIESVKNDILKVLNRMTLQQGKFTFNTIYTRAENVFNGFSLDEVENQYLMHPYSGLRIDGTITAETTCD